MKEAFLYKWTNQVTNEFYIGVHKGTVDDGYIGSGKLFRRKYDKNPEQWSREILAFGYHDFMYQVENEFVTEDVVNSKLCLNLKVGGLGGYKYHPDVEKQRSNAISKALTGRKCSEEHKNAMKGKRPKSFSDMRRDIQTGKKFSEDTKKKMSESQKIRHSTIDSSHTDETKKKISETLKQKNKGIKKLWYVFEDGTKVLSSDKKETIFKSGMKYKRGMKW